MVQIASADVSERTWSMSDTDRRKKTDTALTRRVR